MKRISALVTDTHVAESLSIVSAFVLPFALGTSQIVTGIVVNTALIIAALRFGKNIRLAWIIAPSLAALARGLVFGSATPFLYYFLPVIWFSNWVLVSILSGEMKIASVRGRMFFAGVSKIVILFGCASVLVTLKIIPSIFLTSMGIMQILTLLGGGIVSYFILHLWLPNQTK